MIKENKVESFIKDNDIYVYEVSGLSMNTIFLKEEKDFLSLVKKHNPEIIYRKYHESITTTNETDIYLDVDYDEIYRLLEEKYKFLKAVSDILTVDEYYAKLDNIINKYRISEINHNKPNEFIERYLDYYFKFSESCCYAYGYYESEGQKLESEYISSWEITSQIITSSEQDIINWGKEIVNNITSEYELFNKELLSDECFRKCKNKDARVFRYDEIIDTNYPYLSMYKNESTLMRKLPNFYFAFDKNTRKLYADQAFEKIINH